MSAKATILAAIAANQPGPRTLPQLPPDPSPDRVELQATFRRVLAGSKTTSLDPHELPDYLTDNFGGDQTIVSARPEVPGTLDLATISDPLQLAGVDLVVLTAQLGVAENGAMWVDEADFGGQRVLPFITQHLILFVPAERIVATMHQAYRQVEIGKTGFGVFIAGPSKTADIEQSLVIGAHGPRSLAVVVER